MGVVAQCLLKLVLNSELCNILQLELSIHESVDLDEANNLAFAPKLRQFCGLVMLHTNICIPLIEIHNFLQKFLHYL